MFKNTFTNTLLVLLILFITSCEKSDTPVVENEMEVFTNATIVVTNLSDNSSTTYVFEVEAHAHDDHGAVAPSEGDDDHNDHGAHTIIELDANSEYEFAITFQNNTDASNPIDMTEEVIEEADDHHVFYEFTDSSLTYESTTGDTIDSNGNPINAANKYLRIGIFSNVFIKLTDNPLCSILKKWKYDSETKKNEIITVE